MRQLPARTYTLSPHRTYKPNVYKKRLRRVCNWFHDPIPLDGLGPLRDDDTLSHGMCKECLERALAGEDPR